MVEFTLQQGNDGYTWKARVQWLTHWRQEDLQALSTEAFKDKGIEQGSFCTFTVYRQRNQERAEERRLGTFTFSTMPGCCGAVVSTNSALDDGWRGIKIIGEMFHKLKEHVERELGYSKMIATTQALNLPEVIGASKAGWKLVEPFRNKRTGNDIFFMFKDLK